MTAKPITEVSTEFDGPFADRGVCVVYRDGVEVSAHQTFERAMRAAFPGWEPQGNGHEAALDNF